MVARVRPASSGDELGLGVPDDRSSRLFRNCLDVRDAVKALGIEPASASVAMIPQNYVKLVGKEAQQMLKLMDALDDQDDVQNVWTNFDAPDEIDEE